MLAPWKKSSDKPREHIQKQRRHFAKKSLYTPRYGISSSHLWMWELYYKEGWAPKNWGFWTVMLEKILESPLDSKEIKPVNPKGNQPWIYIGRTDAEAPKLWLPDVKSWLIGKEDDAGKDWRQEKKGTTEDELVGWQHRFSGNEFEQTPEDSDGQEGLLCCSPWGPKESDMTEQLNNENKSLLLLISNSTTSLHGDIGSSGVAENLL